MSTVKSKTSSSNETPLMKQYKAIKGKYPDALLLFRVGDFYETFGSDAVKTASILGIVLTKRHNGSAGEVELAGFPHHSLDNYLPKLVRAGLRVAVCDQLEVPDSTKKIVKRGVTELVTPGVTFSEDVLEKRSNNFLASIHIEKDKYGIAFLDISTGEFLVGEGNKNEVERLIQNFGPSEIIFEKGKSKSIREINDRNIHTYQMDDWAFKKEHAEEMLTNHFQTRNLKGYGIENMNLALVAAGAVMEYLSFTRNDRLQHVTGIQRIESSQYVWMDKFTIRNLELIDSPNNDASTLIRVLDRCFTPMGSRMMRRWTIWPLKNLNELHKRHTAVELFIHDEELRGKMGESLSAMGDTERLITRIAVSKANPREINYLGEALTALANIKKELSGSEKKLFKEWAKDIDPCEEIRSRIQKELEYEAPVSILKGNVIRKGVSNELDELRGLLYSGKKFLIDLQKRETERTGISSLKVAFNNVFGYYIEVRNTHKDKVPGEWIRKQTLVNAERYITEELKEYEAKILGAEEKILELERKLFDDLVGSILPFISSIQRDALTAASLDCLLSFARNALDFNYVQPEMNDGLVLDIKGGRHPVIERNMPIGEDYISNDVLLDNVSQQILMITGPNMAGKSALLRQTALITLMAQMGSFVPASKATLGVVDKIFTRVGASDNISQGESTFMVEMNETASILNNISERSLILLDEIGRGTSTYDGISIAWSIAEYLHEYGGLHPKTLFATHYHELNEMTDSFPRIRNYNVSVRELDDKVVFLRKLKPGGSQHSFGIHVARMAGMPPGLIDRANQVLKQLEAVHVNSEKKKHKSIPHEDDFQLSFFQLDDPVLEQIRDELTRLDIDNLTPVEALMKLNEIKKLVGGK